MNVESLAPHIVSITRSHNRMALLECAARLQAEADEIEKRIRKDIAQQAKLFRYIEAIENALT